LLLNASISEHRLKNNRWPVELFVCLVILPTILGASIYIFFRPQHLLVHDLLNHIGLQESVAIARDYCESVRLPFWILNCIPDGLWVFASTSWIIIIWQGRPPTCFLFASLALGVGSEIGQATSIVPGAYHHLDIAIYCIGFALASLQLRPCNATTILFFWCTARNDRARVW
jgi:hypothetical protein